MEHGPMPGDGHAQGLELLKGDGFVDAGEAGPARGVPDDEMRNLGYGEAPGDARILKVPRLAAEGRARPVREPHALDRRRTRSFHPRTQPLSFLRPTRRLRRHSTSGGASTAVSIRSCGHASSACVMFLLQAAASLAANCSRNFSAMNLL